MTAVNVSENDGVPEVRAAAGSLTPATNAIVSPPVDLIVRNGVKPTRIQCIPTVLRHATCTSRFLILSKPQCRGANQGGKLWAREGQFSKVRWLSRRHEGGVTRRHDTPTGYYIV